jgi:hypothetical protein
MTPRGLLSIEEGGAEAWGAPGSGEPLLLSFVSGWLLSSGIATSIMLVDSFERSKGA